MYIRRDGVPFLELLGLLPSSTGHDFPTLRRRCGEDAFLSGLFRRGLLTYRLLAPRLSDLWRCRPDTGLRRSGLPANLSRCGVDGLADLCFSEN